MGFIGNEIIQSRIWIDPNPKKEPDLNYKHTFPITVFDAVRENMADEDSQTLREALDRIYEELRKRQTIVPDIPANFLMTYAGEVGEIGSIEISHAIPWDADLRSHGRIPTEKAVGDLLQKVGLVDSSGKPIEPETQKVQWSNIIGRPNIYHEFGNHDDGFITQDVVSAAIEGLRKELSEFRSSSEEIVDDMLKRLDIHIERIDNPHQVTAEQVGAPTLDAFNEHLNADNPHGITAKTLGLEKVDNTADEDKPISKATREALEALNKLITDIGNHAGNDVNCVIDISYNRFSGKLVTRYKDESEIVLDIPINGLIDDISYDSTRQTLVVYELSGEKRELNLSNLIYKCVGSKGSEIEITIEDGSNSREQVVKAKILPHSITADMLADDIILGGGGDFTIQDASITTRHLADGSVTTEKIHDRSITGEKLVPQSVDAKALFRADADNQVLITRRANQDPVWGPVVADLIAENAIKERHITDWSVTTPKVADSAITEPKIADGAITERKIPDGSIGGAKLNWNIKLPGTPTNTVSPDDDAAGHELIDAAWLRNFITNYVFTHTNIGRRIIDGENIVPSTNSFEIFATTDANSDPVWTKVSREFIVAKAIGSEEIDDEAVRSKHIPEGEIGSRELFTSERANRILAVLTEGGHPEYTKLVRSMLDENIIGTKQIEDKSVTLSKLTSSDEDYRILGVRLRGTTPEWTLIGSKMIAERAILPEHLFSSELGNVLLSVRNPGENPIWSRVNSEMIDNEAIQSRHLAPGIIKAEHMADIAVDGSKITERSITGDKLAYRAVTGLELFSSPVADRVLAVPKLPYEDPQWTQVTGPMIEDRTIPPEKLESSVVGYRVLGVRNPNDTPEYVRITGEFFEDGAVTSKKLAPDVVLPGTPELEIPPAEEADNNQLASTAWVRRYIEERLKPEICECLEYEQLGEEQLVEIWEGKRTDIPSEQEGPFYGLTEEEVEEIWNSDRDYMLINPGESCPDGNMYEIDVDDVRGAWEAAMSDFNTSAPLGRYVTGKDLFTSDEPGILAVTEPGEDPHWTKLTGELIGEKAVSTEHLAEDLQLGGRPTIAIRPPDGASDVAGIGELIPDCQWVLDRIQEAIANLPGSGGCCGSDSTEWQEILHDIIVEEWKDSGRGDVEADPNEITQEQILAEWISGGSGDITADSDEISDSIVRAMWDNPDAEAGSESEISAEDVLAAYASGGEGSTDADEGEISAEDIQTEWNSSGSGDTTADRGEITKERVDLEWNGIETEDPEYPDDPSSGGSSCGSCCGGGPATSLKGEGIVKNEHIADGVVNGPKLFTTLVPNTVLAVLSAAGIPEYIKVSGDMLLEHTLSGKHLTTSEESNVILAIRESGSDAVWTKITRDFLPKGVVGNNQIENGVLTSDKFRPGSISFEIFDLDTINVDDILRPDSVREIHLRDQAVTTRKIADGSVDDSKIAEHTISGSKLRKETVIPAYTTVESHNDYEKRSIRNTILSPNAPKNARNGDIWFRYY